MKGRRSRFESCHFGFVRKSLQPLQMVEENISVENEYLIGTYLDLVLEKSTFVIPY